MARKHKPIEMTPREQQVLKKRFGIDLSEDADLKAVGEAFDKTRARILEIEGKAIAARAKKSSKQPTTIAAYIDAAPLAGRPHLQKLYEILKSVAPNAD